MAELEDSTPDPDGEGLDDTLVEKGWTLIEDASPFAALIGPIYLLTQGGDRGIRLGFKVRAHHCNPRGACHGGMLATVANLALARALSARPDISAPTPTISMSLDYLAAAPLGEWVEAEANLLHHTAGTGFAQALLSTADGPVLRASGVFRIHRFRADPR